MLKNKKGQVEFGPIILVGVVISLLIFAPIMMRIIGTVTGTFFTQMNTTSPAAVQEADKTVDKVYNFFDYLIIIFLFVNVITLFISSWFIDTNPVFIVLYIMFAFILVLFLPNMLDAVDRVWEKTNDMAAADTWGSNDLNLPFTEWLKRNMIVSLVAIIAITGIIIYAKFNIIGSGGY